LGNCYKALDSNLGSGSNAKINECVTDIDNLNLGYNLPIAQKLVNASDIANDKKTNAYNKSVLVAALQSK
jgi:hypothetical protein